MHPYFYLRAVLFSLVVIAIGLVCFSAQAGEQPKGNIDAIIAVLKHNKAAGAKDVVVMISEEHDGPPTRRLRAISAVGPAPGAPDVAIILVIDGKDI